MVKLRRSFFKKLHEQNAEDLKPFYGERENYIKSDSQKANLSTSICVHLWFKK